MIVIAEGIIILILVTSLIILIIEEARIKKSKIPRGTLKEYWNGKERRQAFRINTSLAVKYSVEKKLHIKINGLIKDVSSSGMRLLINEKLSNETLLLLEFDLPELKNTIGAEGKVIWADGNFTERDKIGRRIFQTGIQFVNIKPNDKSKLVAYIEKHSQKASV